MTTALKDRLSSIRFRVLALGLPEEIVLDNGPEMTGQALDKWAERNSVRLRFINPGKPVQNGFIESFNGCAAASVALSGTNASTKSCARSLRDDS